MRLIFDIEADALLDSVSHIWCIAAVDPDTGQRWFFDPDNLDAGLALLDTAEMLIGHNILTYDIPALTKVLGWKPKTKEFRDTLVMCQYIFSDQKSDDKKHPDTRVRAFEGSHSLEAWGLRLNCHKMDYKGPWDAYSPQMGVYCQQDVETNRVIYQHCEKAGYVSEGLLLEQYIAVLYAKMTDVGFGFDIDRAKVLDQELESQIERLQTEVSQYIQLGVEETSTPEYWEMTWPDGSKERAPTKGELEVKRKQLGHKPKECSLERGPNKTKPLNPYAGPSAKNKPFNPGSGQQIRNYLSEKYGWISPRLTDKGNDLLNAGGDYDTLAKEYGQTSEELLRTLEWPEARVFADTAMVSKVRSMLSSGKNGWMKRVGADGRIHARFIGCACVTHRSASSGPNLQQVPSVSVGGDKQVLWGFDGRYGADCRALFLPLPGHMMVGTDLSGIEARMLAHYLTPYDGGAYTTQLLEGDIHQLNVDALKEFAGYSISRSASKLLMYAWLYGVGGEKQGRQACFASEVAMAEFRDKERFYEKHPNKITRKRYLKGTKVPYRASDMAFADVGERVNAALEQGIAGMDRLKAAVQAAAERKYLRVLDRTVPVRKAHSALNSLLQCSAGIVCKRWVASLHKNIQAQQMPAALLGVIHDEVQASVCPAAVSQYSELAVDCIAYAGEYYRLSLPLTGESKQGANWAETH